MSKPQYIETPEEFEALFEEYVAQVKATSVNVIHPKLGTAELVNEAPITMEGFKAWARKHKKLTLLHYIHNSNNEYEKFQEVILYIKDVIFDHNFRGAACGKYKENLIIRQLALRENTDNTNVNRNIEITMDLGDKKLNDNQV